MSAIHTRLMLLAEGSFRPRGCAFRDASVFVEIGITAMITGILDSAALGKPAWYTPGCARIHAGVRYASRKTP